MTSMPTHINQTNMSILSLAATRNMPSSLDFLRKPQRIGTKTKKGQLDALLKRNTDWNRTQVRAANEEDERSSENRGLVSLQRSKSLPASPPTSAFRRSRPGVRRSKSVHFGDSDVVSVKYFDADESIAVPSGSQPQFSSFNFTVSPASSATDLHLPISVNFTHVALTSLHLFPQQVITGKVTVTNLHFQKSVLVRYSTDRWKHLYETHAVWISSPDPLHDIFEFAIDLPSSQDPLILHLCIRYQVRDEHLQSLQTHWDNNDGENYIIKCG
ncbi:HCL147Wp [Eremothecium sinecaudum]|uniref:HCL147Wp n=1 Tax=Eremothecium sinecaudum TaxID=45286 RepID=A0A0X8HRB1_9SACH|nr:HCL147Wp [Eremothecium sinecaudum]AMD20004.1 HCL147Wp [Eremothecium sinecaudum]